MCCAHHTVSWMCRCKSLSVAAGEGGCLMLKNISNIREGDGQAVGHPHTCVWMPVLHGRGHICPVISLFCRVILIYLDYLSPQLFPSAQVPYAG